MNIERIQLKGQLAEAKSKYKHLDTEAAALILLIRAVLNPFEEDPTKIEVVRIVVITSVINFFKFISPIQFPLFCLVFLPA